MIDYPKIPDFGTASGEISLTLWNFKAGISTSEKKLVEEQRIRRSQCNGPKKVEIAKSIDEFMTSRPIGGELISLSSMCLMRY